MEVEPRGARTPWQAANLADLHARLAPLRGARNGTIYTEPSGHHFHVVTKENTRLRFWLVEQTNPSTGVIQSEIDVARPLALLEPYTQAMTLALLWQPRPAAVYMAGLGGGRSPLALHHHFPGCVIDCTEIDPAVVGVARRFFGVEQDARLRVAIEDGRVRLERHATRYDLILLDVFLDNGYSPYRMATREFFTLCRARLQPGGVLVTNLLAGDPWAARKAQTLAAVFPYVWSYTLSDENWVLFGRVRRGESPLPSMAVARDLAAQHVFDYPFVAQAARLLPGLGDLETPVAQPPLTDDAPPPGYFDDLPALAGALGRVAPDLPCPCGSGRRFDACHGARGGL